MKRMAFLAPLAALTLAGLSACATDPYGRGPAGGVAETRIASDRFRVSYRGAGDAGYAFDQALVRAAHLAVQDGADWFVVEDRYSEIDAGRSSGGPVISLGGSNFSFGRRSASSIGAGIGFQLGGGSRPHASTTLQVRTGRGLPPEGAYAARDVIATIGPRL